MNFLKISSFLIALFIVSCNPLDVGNEQHFSEVLSIVVNENGVKHLENRFSTFSTRECSAARKSSKALA